MLGGIEKRSPHAWRITVSDGYNMDGTQRRVRITVNFEEGMTEKRKYQRCEEVAAETYAKLKAGQVVPWRQYTLRDFAEIWLEDYCTAKKLSEITVQGYRDRINGRILSDLGHIRIDKLTGQKITQFYNKLAKEPCTNNGSSGETLSDASIQSYHRVLRVMLNTAVRWGYIATNPVKNAVPPSHNKKKTKVYDAEQSAKMLDLLRNEPLKHQVAIALGLLCQMRLGEIAGLNWADIDFAKSTLMIERSAVLISGKGMILKEPKTEAGKRKIALPADVVELLRKLKVEEAEHRLKLGDLWEDSGAVLTQWDGKRQYCKTPSSWFQKFLEKNHLPPIRFHDLRHTGASLMMNYMNIPTQIVADRLGHSDSTVTLRFYSHGYAQKDRTAANELNDLLRINRGKSDG